MSEVKVRTPDVNRSSEKAGGQAGYRQSKRVNGYPGEQTGVGARGAAVCVGFPVWKRPHVKPFFFSVCERVVHIDNPLRAVNYAKSNNCRIITWASSEKEGLTVLANSEGIDVIHMEDGFLRSVGLGSDFHVPYSLVLDRKGIYYDSTRPSELECVLEEGGFDSQVLERACRLRGEIIKRGISKYNTGSKAINELDLPKDRPVIFVPGQVENDASVLRCSSDIDTNLKLLEAVRQARPNAFICYKPHPDVQAGNRPGRIPDAVASKFCDMIVGNVSAASFTEIVDEVHTISSLTGFEALLRGREVHTYGGPFYAGWGLTTDRLVFPRRSRKITLDELVAAALILYPTYYDWETLRLCGPERILGLLSAQSDHDPDSHGQIRRLIRMLFKPHIKRRI